MVGVAFEAVVLCWRARIVCEVSEDLGASFHGARAKILTGLTLARQRRVQVCHMPDRHCLGRSSHISVLVPNCRKAGAVALTRRASDFDPPEPSALRTRSVRN